MSGSPMPPAEGATHRGTIRAQNEDAFLTRPDLGLWAVADGAGGHGAGDVASRMVVEALADIPPGLSAAEMLAQLRLRLAAVHDRLREQAAAQQGAGGIIATTVVVLIARAGHIACLWAGDSRIYRLRRAVLDRITTDHSLVQDLVDRGALTAQEAERHPQANVITRAVGAGEELVLDKRSFASRAGDVYLLCSDGLSKALDEARIAALLEAGASAERLVEAALENGARDNVTAVRIDMGEEAPLPEL